MSTASGASGLSHEEMDSTARSCPFSLASVHSEARQLTLTGRAEV